MSTEAETPSPEAAEPVAEETTSDETAEEAPYVGRTIKVNGVEKVLTKEEEEAVFANYQRFEAGNQKLAEAAELRKQVESYAQQVIDQLKTDPFGLLARPELGVNVEEHIAAYQKKLEAEKALTPEQKRLQELEAEVARNAGLQQQMYDYHLNQMFEEALGTGKIPATYDSVRRLAHATKLALDAGIEATTEQLVEYVAKSYRDDLRYFSEKLGDEEFDRVFGEDLSGKARSVAGKKAPPKPKTAPVKTPAVGSAAPLSIEEAANRLIKKFG